MRGSARKTTRLSENGNNPTTPTPIDFIVMLMMKTATAGESMITRAEYHEGTVQGQDGA